MTNAEIADQLEPCPFCGKVPRVVDNGGAEPRVYSLAHDCEAIGYWSTPGWRSAKAIVRDWNVRAV